jgi:transcriptional regulator with XRE-family HTH domain
MQLDAYLDAEAFWEGVRHSLRAYLDANRGASNGAGKLTQAKLAGSLGIHPATLANFLSGTNHQLSGFAVARACTLGIEFSCDQHRIGSLDDQDALNPVLQQLVLEFSDDFSVAQPSNPLIIELRPKPSQSVVRRVTRLKVS